jgi:hypothetical protein
VEGSDCATSPQEAGPCHFSSLPRFLSKVTVSLILGSRPHGIVTDGKDHCGGLDGKKWVVFVTIGFATNQLV